jgi:transcriptional regulator GlxA family with amidase domain
MNIVADLGVTSVRLSPVKRQTLAHRQHPPHLRQLGDGAVTAGMPPSYRPDIAERILQALRSEVPAALLPAFRFCLEYAEGPFSAEQVAEACGIRRRALEYRFRRAGLAPPGTCLAWSRLLLAVHHLEQGTDSIERVALEHGFGTAGALRKSLARHLGVAPHSLRRPGAFEAAVVGFLDAVRRGSSRWPTRNL